MKLFRINRYSTILRIAIFSCAFLFISSSSFSQLHDKKAKKLFLEGTVKIKKNDYQAALRDLNEALRIEPGFLEAYENRGVAKYHLKDFHGAIDDFNKALEINPNDLNTMGRRGWALFSIGRYMDAVSDFTKVIQELSDNASYYNIRGRAKYQLRDYEGAIFDFTEVINSYSSGKAEKGKAFYWRGMIRIETGNKESGCNDLQQASKLGRVEADILLEVHCKV